ncbi:MAG: hypothetical protein J6S67_17555 [Methanobrevibacter sp.]|nr:hypothetical protein [Methanobrevibacter sp.]
MNKEQYIARYGEEAYKLYLQNRKRKRDGLPPIKKNKPVNNITVKVCAEANMDMSLEDRLEEQNKIAAKLQRRLSGWWAHETDKRFILVTDYSNIKLSTRTICYKIDLTQLNLDEETIAKFTEGVKTKVKEFLDSYGKDI